MIDLKNETAITMTQAAAMLPRGRLGKRVHRAVLFRWILKGVPTPSGNIRLEAFEVDGTWMTTSEAVGRFRRQARLGYRRSIHVVHEPAAVGEAEEKVAQSSQ